MAVYSKETNPSVKLAQPKGLQLVIPFFNTNPWFDLQWSLVLLPLWWILGIEQLVWPAIYGWASIKLVLFRKFRVCTKPITVLLFCFIFIHLLSGFFITEGFRYLTFARNLSTYMSSFFLLFILTNLEISWQRVGTILDGILMMMFLASFIGLVGISGLWQPEINSLMSYVLPSSIKSTGYGGQVAYKIIGQSSWFVFIGRYFRVSSFFIYSTLYASAIAFTLPIAFFRLSITSRIRHKFLLLIVIACLTVNLLFTTGRIAIVSLLVGGLYYLIVVRKLNFHFKQKYFIPLSIVLLGLLGLGVMALVAPDILTETLNQFLFARGSGSFEARSFVYGETLKGVLERPLLGWGTERDIPGFPYPMGSHSYYLGILYKQGILGFTTFMAILTVAWWQTSPLDTRMANSADEYYLARFLEYGRWIFVAVLLNGTTDVLELDAITSIIIWLLLSLLMVSRSHLIATTVSRP